MCRSLCFFSVLLCVTRSCNVMLRRVVCLRFRGFCSPVVVSSCVRCPVQVFRFEGVPLCRSDHTTPSRHYFYTVRALFSRVELGAHCSAAGYPLGRKFVNRSPNNEVRRITRLVKPFSFFCLFFFFALSLLRGNSPVVICLLSLLCRYQAEENGRKRRYSARFRARSSRSTCTA